VNIFPRRFVYIFKDEGGAYYVNAIYDVVYLANSLISFNKSYLVNLNRGER